MKKAKAKITKEKVQALKMNLSKKMKKKKTLLLMLIVIKNLTHQLKTNLNQDVRRMKNTVKMNLCFWMKKVKTLFILLSQKQT